MTVTDFIDSIRDTASRFVTCCSWEDLEALLKTGYVPTIHSETEYHKRLRRCILNAGYHVFPCAQVKLTKLTGTQRYHIEDYLSCLESSSDRRVVRDAKLATVTRTTATLSYDLAADFIYWLAELVELAESEDDVIDQARSLSFKALTHKVNRALWKAV